MRVLLINQVFYPDVAATAQHAHDLARHLVHHGHEVHVIASRSIYGQQGASLPARETHDGVHIHRVGRSLFGKRGILTRLLDFALFYLAATLKALRVPRPDVAVCFTTPPFIALLGWALRVLRGSRYVYWVMDLYPDVAVACGVMGERSPLTRLLERLNRFCLRKADRAVVLGRCMLERVRDKGVDHGQVRLIGVWSDTVEVAPIPRSENPYRHKWDLGDRFVVMYSGNFGLGHDVETMLHAAKRLADDDSIRFVFVGGGKRKERVDRFIAEHSLPNAVSDGYQPRDMLDRSLSVADAHLVSIREGVEGLVVPCKLFGIMAAARPTLFIGNPASEIARVVQENDCGLVVHEGDDLALVKAIRSLQHSPETTADMGARARHALGDVYDRRLACERWRTLLEEVVAPDHARSNGDRPTVRPPTRHDTADHPPRPEPSEANP